MVTHSQKTSDYNQENSLVNKYDIRRILEDFKPW